MKPCCTRLSWENTGEIEQISNYYSIIISVVSYFEVCFLSQLPDVLAACGVEHPVKDTMSEFTVMGWLSFSDLEFYQIPHAFKMNAPPCSTLNSGFVQQDL